MTTPGAGMPAPWDWRAPLATEYVAIIIGTGAGGGTPLGPVTAT